MTATTTHDEVDLVIPGRPSERQTVRGRAVFLAAGSAVEVTSPAGARTTYPMWRVLEIRWRA